MTIINKHSGFTIVELLVVIVIIAILAAITLVSYTGISSRATVSSLQSDLTNAVTQLKLDQVNSSSSSFPTTLALANGGKGIPSSSGTSYTYAVSNTTTPPTFCITATKNNISYNITQDGNSQPGICPVLNLDAGNISSYPGTGTTWTDLSGNGNSGTLYGGVTYASTNGGVLSFDGVSGRVDCGNNLEWPGALSVASWNNRTLKDSVNADTIVGNWSWDPLLANRRGWVLRYYINTDTLDFRIEVTNGTLIQELVVTYNTNINNWYYTVGVFDPADRTIKLYVNGILRATATASVGYNQIAYDSSYQVQVGYNPVNNGYFTGQIGETSIYNTPLTSDDITQNFNSLRGRYGI